MDRFRILPGLPATGPWPEQFSATGRGTHREGFVVEFFPGSMPPWVGNFQPGATSYNAVLPLSDEGLIVVVADGQASMIEPNKRRLVRTFGGGIDNALAVPGFNLMIFSDGLHLEAWGAAATQWRTRRLSWDGIWGLHVDQNWLRGYAWDAIDDQEQPFSVDLRTGDVEGGAYREPHAQ